MARKPTSIPVSGPRVAEARRAAALTQAEVAARASITLSNVKRIEQRAVAGVFPWTLRAIAEAVGVEPDALLHTSPTNAPKPPKGPADLKLPFVIAWLDRQRLDVVGEVLEHAGSILDLAASANGRRKPGGGSTTPRRNDAKLDQRRRPNRCIAATANA